MHIVSYHRNIIKALLIPIMMISGFAGYVPRLTLEEMIALARSVPAEKWSRDFSIFAGTRRSSYSANLPAPGKTVEITLSKDNFWFYMNEYSLEVQVTTGREFPNIITVGKVDGFWFSKKGKLIKKAFNEVKQKCAPCEAIRECEYAIRDAKRSEEYRRAEFNKQALQQREAYATAVTAVSSLRGQMYRR